MLILVFILFFITSLFALFSSDDCCKKVHFYVVWGFVFVLVATFRDGDVLSDYTAYTRMYESIKEGNSLPTELTFMWISMLSSSSLILFAVYAILGVGLKLVAIRQLSELWILSLVIYISNFFILHDMTQIRVGVASALLLLCIKPIYERNWRLFLCFCFLAFIFHSSSLIIFPLWFIGNSKKCKLLLSLSIPAAYLIYFLGINLISVIPVASVEEKIMMYQQLQELDVDGFANINVFNLVFLAKIFIFYLLLWKCEMIEKHNKYAIVMVKIFCISLVSFPLFANMPVFGFRINELFGVIEIVLFPLIYYIFNPKKLSKLLVVLLGFLVLSISIFYNKLILWE